MTPALPLFAVLLVLWGNVVEYALGGTAVLPGGSVPFVASGVALVAVSLLAARAIGLDAAALGLRARGMPRAAAAGIAFAASVALVALLSLRVAPLVIGLEVVYDPVAGLSRGDLVRHLAVFLPFAVALPEELAFRGTLLAALRRVSGARAATLASAAIFAAWHVLDVCVTVMATTLAAVPAVALAAVAAALVVVFVGGALLAALRLATGSLASAIAAHWTFNAAILVGFWVSANAGSAA